MTEEEMQELAYKCGGCGGFEFLARPNGILECANSDCGQQATIAAIDFEFDEVRRNAAH